MASVRTNSPDGGTGFPSDLLVTLDRSAGRGLRLQLEGELRRAIRGGRLAIWTALPPPRVLADELGVARGVVVDAYGQLAAEGYLEARQGSGTRVRAGQAPAPPAAPPNPRPRAAAPPPPRPPLRPHAAARPARACSAGCPIRRASPASSGSATTAPRSRGCRRR